MGLRILVSVGVLTILVLKTPRLDGVLPSGYLEKRVDWHARVRGLAENLNR